MLLKRILSDTFHLFYPQTCIGCGNDLYRSDSLLCIKCISQLPHTNFAIHEANPIENLFRGRINIKAAHSEFYFSKNELIQHLIHELKYKGNRDIGLYLGEVTGNSILKSGRFRSMDCLVPLPLYADKEFRRGYNQAEIICNGIGASTNIPLITNNLIRMRETETQTRKHRMERWLNVEGSFIVQEPGSFENKHILLVDDVITTGATLEACGQVLLNIPGTDLSIASLAHASR